MVVEAVILMYLQSHRAETAETTAHCSDVLLHGPPVHFLISSWRGMGTSPRHSVTLILETVCIRLIFRDNSKGSGEEDVSEDCEMMMMMIMMWRRSEIMMMTMMMMSMMMMTMAMAMRMTMMMTMMMIVTMMIMTMMMTILRMSMRKQIVLLAEILVTICTWMIMSAVSW